jgi:ABC-type polysaccharide/polyol phosphate transport system ATPase subunit
VPANTVRGRTVLSARKVYSPASIVLRGVDLELVGGRAQGLLDANGAGKSMLIKILAE